ncbi:TrmB family transcriptional regulator [Methanothermobacter wolfeii]|uniref:TrmB family transcriptional regulator n=1 Tax=Methanothermobacter wolfeii TaxID=145261 RepID=UPI0024B37C72|nr:TrmB family transcriptional regulator [Methanothermobacter wolfeii]MDI6701755.1 TrmB family transcriptional regulator [Methanothermobacter wolfeii]
MERRIRKALRLMGLTDYEASAYTALTSLVSGRAGEVGEAAGIPRSRVYDILRKLAEKGFVEVERGKPMRYHAVPPSEVFRREKKRINEVLHEAGVELTRIYEDQISRVPAPVWLIHGQEKIIKKEIEIISRSRHEFKMRMGFFFRGELKTLEPVLGRINDRGVDVRVMAGAEIRGLPCRVRIVEMPPVKMMVRDGEEMMWVFSRFTPDGSPIPETAIGIWNQYPEIAENYSRIFDTIWEGGRAGI